MYFKQNKDWIFTAPDKTPIFSIPVETFPELNNAQAEVFVEIATQAVHDGIEHGKQLANAQFERVQMQLMEITQGDTPDDAA